MTLEERLTPPAGVLFCIRLTGPSKNPYKAAAGSELDALISEALFPDSSAVLPFSTDDKAADKVKTQLKQLYGHSIVVGRTRMPDKKFFARFDTGPSTSTEVLAETYALAICRLALVISASHKRK